MALVIEDGTGKPDATTFSSREDFLQFALARGVTVPDTEASDVHLVKAMDYLAIENWDGGPAVADQGTPFPRKIYKSADTDELKFPDDVVPAPVKRAQLLLAVASYEGIELLARTGAGQRQVKRREMGPLKREFEGEALERANVAGVAELIAPFLANPSGFSLIVGRA